MTKPTGKRETPSIDLESLRLDPSLVGDPKPPIKKRPRYRGRFLKGPIPFTWIDMAVAIGGAHPIAVGLALWHLRGIKLNERTVALSNVEVQQRGLSRQAKWRALVALEKAGLISIERRGSASPMVTIIVHADDELGQP
jgi:hypothetical protein